MRRLWVCCGSSPGLDEIHRQTARELGELILERDLELIYGGADVGLMGEIADVVLRGGGRVIGVIPEAFADKVSHRGLAQLHVVDSMHERKRMMFDLADATIGLSGGVGTLEEVAEVLTWAQLGFHTKPCGLLNAAGYYDRLLEFLDHAAASGFMKQVHREMLLVSDSASELLDKMRTYEPPRTPKWEGLERGS